MWRCRGAQRIEAQGDHGSTHQQVDPDLHQRPDHAQATQPQEDNMNDAVKRQDITIYTIASVKGHLFAQEYNPASGKVEDRHFYHALKQGYVEGFLAGFEHKLTGE
jgi:hypothetical protein